MAAILKVVLCLSIGLPAGLVFSSTPKNTMTTLSFGRKSQKEDLFISTQSCEFALDNTDNWQVEVEADKYVVSTMAKSESPGVLIINCPEGEHFISLIYDWKLGGRKQGESSQGVERVAGFELSGSTFKSTASKPAVGLSSRIYDRSFNPFQLDVAHQNNLEGAQATRLEIGHRIGDVMTAYGIDQRVDSVSSSKKYQGRFGRASYQGLSLYLRNESEVGGAEGSETIYVGTPSPIGLSYLSESNSEGIQIQRLSRGLGWSINRLSFFNLLTLTSERSEDSSLEYLDWRSTIGALLFAGTSMYGKWQSRCPANASTLNCKIHDARLAARTSYKDFGFEPIYVLFPHEINLNLDWEPDTYQTYALQIRAGLGDSPIPEKFISEEFADKKWNALASSSYLYPWRGIDYSLLTQLPFNNEWDPTYVTMAFIADKNLEGSSYSGGLYFKPLAQTALDSIQVRYASSLLENINSFAAKVLDRSIEGEIVSNIRNLGVSGVSVTCFSGAIALNTVVTGDDGFFSCKVPPGVLVAKVSAQRGKFASEAMVEFEKSDRSQKMAVFLDTEREVRVKFYLDADRDGELGAKDTVLPLRNFVPVAEELIVNYDDNKPDSKVVIVESGRVYRMKLNQALLPFQFKVANIFGDLVDTTKSLNEGYEVAVLLQTK